MKMYQKIVALAFGAAVFSGSANALLMVDLDFVALAAGNEGGVEGDSFFFTDGAGDGVSVVLTSSGAAYLDDVSGGRPGGLGVCSNNADGTSGLNGANQCTDRSDDNITATEWVTLDFGLNTVSNIGTWTFNDGSHNPLPTNGSGTQSFLVAYDIAGSEPDPFNVDPAGGIFEAIFDNPTAFPNVPASFSSITFAFNNTGVNAQQFYISGATGINAVPLPGSVALLGAGLFGMGMVGRLRKRRSKLV